MKKLIALLLSIGVVGSAAAVDTVKVMVANNKAWEVVDYMPETCQKYDLKVEVIKADGKVLMSNAIIGLDRGDFDIASIPLQKAILSAANGSTMSVVTNLSTGGLQLIAKPEIKKLSDLVGKRVGILQNSHGEVEFLNYLEKEGIIKDKNNLPFKKINLSMPMMTQAMAQGDVDAVLQSFPDLLGTLKYGTALQEINTARPLFTTKLPDQTKQKVVKCVKEIVATLNKGNNLQKHLEQIGIPVTNDTIKYAFKMTTVIPQDEVTQVVKHLKQSGKINETFELPATFNLTDK